MNAWLEVFGWIGSILVVVSLMQARVARFRWINLAGALAATAYNAIVGIWPFVAMNAAITIIDIYWLRRLYREADDPDVYQVIAARPDDPYVAHLLAVHATDIRAHEPAFDPVPRGEHRAIFLVVRGDEAVGVVALRDEGNGTGTVELDWVKPRFRDFTPGQFVYRDSGALPAAGFARVVITPHEHTDREYLRHAGFRTEGASWVRELTA